MDAWFASANGWPVGNFQSARVDLKLLNPYIWIANGD